MTVSLNDDDILRLSKLMRDFSRAAHKSAPHDQPLTHKLVERLSEGDKRSLRQHIKMLEVAALAAERDGEAKISLRYALTVISFMDEISSLAMKNGLDDEFYNLFPAPAKNDSDAIRFTRLGAESLAQFSMR